MPLMALSDYVPVARRVELTPRAGGMFWTNPSITPGDGGYVCILKGVNFDRQDLWHRGDWDDIGGGRERIRVDNLLLKLDRDYRIANETILPRLPDADTREHVVNLEDLRLFRGPSGLMCIGSRILVPYAEMLGRWFIAREPTASIVIGPVTASGIGDLMTLPSPTNSEAEKNWIVLDGVVEAVALCADITARARVWIDVASRRVQQLTPARWNGGWSGSTPAVAVSDKYLAVVHRKSMLGSLEVYEHMFIVCDREFRVHRVSPVFTFEGQAVEFACGLMVDEADDRLAVSYGVWDRTAKVVECRLSDVLALCGEQISDNLRLGDIAVGGHDYCQAHLSSVLEALAAHRHTIYRNKALIFKAWRARAPKD